MRYTFKDIYNEKMYKDTQVLIITGQYNIFNNIVDDKFRELCKGKIDIDDNIELMQEFQLSEFNTDGISSNSLSFMDFLQYVKSPPVTGKWFCSVSYNAMTKKERELLKNYYKNPSKNGVLIIKSFEYIEYKEFIRDRVLANSLVSSIIQLGFPSRSVLSQIVKSLCEQRGSDISSKAIDLFIMRMSSSYDEYEDILDRICLDMKGEMITYKDMLEHLKGIENFILEDFLMQLTVPIKSRKIVSNRKIYKMERAMISEFGARKLVSKLKYKIDDILEMRYIINKGIIPINVKYSVKEAKERMGEGNRLAKLSDLAFKKTAYLASKSSLKDWMFIKLMLDSVGVKSKDAEFERVIHMIVNRSVFSENRLMNDIGIIDVLDEQLYSLNSIPYEERCEYNV